MRTKIATLVVLASLLAIAAIGAAGANAGPLGEASPLGAVEETGGGLTKVAPPALTAPACANGVDDDGDGLVDMEDPDCSEPGDESEAPESAAAETTTPTAPAAEGTATVPGTTGGDQPGAGTGNGGGEKLHQGTTIGGGGQSDQRGGVTLNEGIGDESGGSSSGGAVEAPSATGGGDQPLAEEEGDGGSPFGAGGAPTLGNPTTTIAPFGPAPIGVPNFVIDSFEIPPFLLPIYQACGTEYGIPWEVLAAINKIETGFGTNLNVSSAGAVGWMQFLPSSWETYGLDANGDGRKDPYNPVDAICAAAHYLKVAGGQHDLYDAILAYNHADWYAQEVLLYARAYGKLPSDLVGSLTGLTEGAHFPIAANARYADDISARASLQRSNTDSRISGNAAEVISSSPTRRGINIFAKRGAPVVAVNDGIIRKIGHSPSMGSFIVLEDTFGNRYTYAGLGQIVRDHRFIVLPSGQEKRLPVETQNLRPRLRALPERAAKDGAGEEEGGRQRLRANSGSAGSEAESASGTSASEVAATTGTGDPSAATTKAAETISSSPAGGEPPAAGTEATGIESTEEETGTQAGEEVAAPSDGKLRVGSRVIAGTVLARVGEDEAASPHINFSIRPAGKGAPRIDPKPILDGWKLLEATSIYRAKGKNPFNAQLSGAGVLLLSKEALQKRVLDDKGLDIYPCGREDIETGQIDRRVLAVLEYLRSKGFEMRISALKCGHSYLTTSGNVSEHSTGDAVDIAEINGIPVTGHQGPGTLVDQLIKDVLQLQGTMQPHQVISLEDLPGETSFALPDHYDHVHIGYHPDPGSEFEAQYSALLKPEQWQRLIGRLGQIENPEVPIGPSKFSIPDEEGPSQGGGTPVGED